MVKVLATEYTSGIKRFFVDYRKQNRFTIVAILTMLLLVIATPIIVSRQQLIEQQAVEISYVTRDGVGPNSIFTISNLTAQNITQNQATIRLTTSIETTGTVQYWKASLFSSLLALIHTPTLTDEIFAKQHVLTTPATLIPGTMYYYKVTAISRSGEKFTSPTYTFTTLAE